MRTPILISLAAAAAILAGCASSGSGGRRAAAACPARRAAAGCPAAARPAVKAVACLAAAAECPAAAVACLVAAAECPVACPVAARYAGNARRIFSLRIHARICLVSRASPATNRAAPVVPAIRIRNPAKDGESGSASTEGPGGGAQTSEERRQAGEKEPRRFARRFRQDAQERTGAGCERTRCARHC